MSIRRITLVSIAVAATQCGLPTEKGSVSPAETAAIQTATVSRQPTPRQKKALANPLHIAHLEADEPVECRACHSIQGRTPATRVVKHRCLGCHEDQRSAVHAAVADPTARECLSCHEFFETQADEWACIDCHRPATESKAQASVAGNGDVRRAIVSALAPTAPPVAVHEKDCRACHQPHGEAHLAPKPCVSCHEDQRAVHASADPKGRTSRPDPEQCLECHGGHAPARAARTTCARCHDADVPKAAIVTGHDTCLSCHQPHSASGKKSCQSCHEDQQTLASGEHLEHDRCLNCHRPHAARVSALAECVGCHEDHSSVVPEHHPADDRAGTCVGCHPQHPIEGVMVKAATCSGCHEDTTSDTQRHAETTCRSCHQPHAFNLKSRGAALCKSCHVGATPAHPHPQQAKRVKPIEGHDTCTDCHVEAHHTPENARADCGTCHEEPRLRISKSHDQCRDCHRPHDGARNKACVDCHDDRLASGRHAPQAIDCHECHSIHTAPPRSPPACISCHERPLPLLHQNTGHAKCADCHTFHEEGKRGDRKSCTTDCHQTLGDHEPEAQQCTGCHPFEGPPKETRR